MLNDLTPWLLTMAVLIGCSAFFSASETALFYLRWPDRRALEQGNRSQRTAAALLEDPDRLLTAVLFWNLVVNMAYFAIVSIAGLQLRDTQGAGDSGAALFSGAALLMIIFCSEMVPKSVAVMAARPLAGLVGLPLAVAIRIVDPLLPTFRVVNLLSRRLIWPRFQAEPYLELSDMERAIELSTTDAQLVEQERMALQNIVQLSDIRVNEWMRPRTQFQTFRPPVSLDQLGGRMTPSGYLLVTEADSEEVASAINLQGLATLPKEHLEHLAEAVVCVPWCATVAEVWQQLRDHRRDVAAVVNEFGETIGILTLADIVDTVFTENPSRSRRLTNRPAIVEVRTDVWHVTGMTSVRRLARQLNAPLPVGKSVTVAGVLQEALQRLVEVGDECDWGEFRLRVLEAPQRGQLVAELSRRPDQEDEP